jgi:hypothetical protein
MEHNKVAVMGHAGIGHAHGYAGFIQDDAGGFITVGAMLRHILNTDTHIKRAEADPDANTITITTLGGGSATTSPRRGVTPAEARLIAELTGQDALFCQALAVRALGRIYGQGVLETPVALQAALANSVIDTFTRQAPDRFTAVQEGVGANRGLIGGLSVERDRVSVSYLASVNYTVGGLGPAEDLEGNVALGSKGDIMRTLNMLKCPTIVVEGKAYLPAISKHLEHNTFLVRAQEGIDNLVIAQALVDAAVELGYPVILRQDLLPRIEGSMARQTADFADRVIDCARRLKGAELASHKVRLVADMALLISQDAGAITCLSNRLHDVVRGAGMIPGTSAVLSILVTQRYLDHWKIPLFEPQDADGASDIVRLAIDRLAENYDAAVEELERHYEGLE